MMSLTEKQARVLGELRSIGRKNVFRYCDKYPSIYKSYVEKVMKGDEYCAFGMGGLSSQVGYSVGLSASSVLSVFKALQKKGLVLSEINSSGKPRCLYWWPVGLANELAIEIKQRTTND